MKRAVSVFIVLAMAGCLGSSPAEGTGADEERLLVTVGSGAWKVPSGPLALSVPAGFSVFTLTATTDHAWRFQIEVNGTPVRAEYSWTASLSQPLEVDDFVWFGTAVGGSPPATAFLATVTPKVTVQHVSDPSMNTTRAQSVHTRGGHQAIPQTAHEALSFQIATSQPATLVLEPQPADASASFTRVDLPSSDCRQPQWHREGAIVEAVGVPGEVEPIQQIAWEMAVAAGEARLLFAGAWFSADQERPSAIVLQARDMFEVIGPDGKVLREGDEYRMWADSGVTGTTPMPGELTLPPGQSMVRSSILSAHGGNGAGAQAWQWVLTIPLNC